MHPDERAQLAAILGAEGTSPLALRTAALKAKQKARTEDDDERQADDDDDECTCGHERQEHLDGEGRCTVAGCDCDGYEAEHEDEDEDKHDGAIRPGDKIGPGGRRIVRSFTAADVQALEKHPTVVTMASRSGGLSVERYAAGLAETDPKGARRWLAQQTAPRRAPSKPRPFTSKDLRRLERNPIVQSIALQGAHDVAKVAKEYVSTCPREARAWLDGAAA
jgi:hypothetical protein